LGFLSTLNAKSLKLTGTYTSSAAASSGTFLLVLLLTLGAGNHIRDPPPMIGCGSGRFWYALFHSLSLWRALFHSLSLWRALFHSLSLWRTLFYSLSL
jgi:hypothetical protein